MLESLIALTILSLALASLLESQSNGLRTVGLVDEQIKASLLAQSLLEEQTANAVALQVGNRRGTYGKYAWELSVAPARGRFAFVSSKRRWRLYNVVLTVSWPPQRRLQLQTLKLGRNQ